MITRFINDVLRKFWPENKQGDRTVWFSSQNLNEDENGDPKGLPTHGRCWLFTPHGRYSAEWNLSKSWKSAIRVLGVDAHSDGEDGGLDTSISIFPVALYLSNPVPLKWWKENVKYSNRNFFSVYLTPEGALHWQFGGDTMSWSSKTPKWKHGSFDFVDAVLGERVYKEGTPEERQVQIPMPEGVYDATVKLQTDTWTRPRGRTEAIRRAHVDIPLGIPFPGKGENSWDCGEDATYGYTGPADSVEAAIASVVARVLTNRRERGGGTYPPPAQRAVEIAALRAAAAARKSDDNDRAETPS